MCSITSDCILSISPCCVMSSTMSSKLKFTQCDQTKQNQCSLNLLSQMPDVLIFGSISLNWKMTAEMLFLSFYLENKKWNCCLSHWLFFSIHALDTWQRELHEPGRWLTTHVLRNAFYTSSHLGLCSFRKCSLYFPGLMLYDMQWHPVLNEILFQVQDMRMLVCERDRDTSGESSIKIGLLSFFHTIPPLARTVKGLLSWHC